MGNTPSHDPTDWNYWGINPNTKNFPSISEKENHSILPTLLDLFATVTSAASFFEGPYTGACITLLNALLAQTQSDHTSEVIDRALLNMQIEELQAATETIESNLNFIKENRDDVDTIRETIEFARGNCELWVNKFNGGSSKEINAEGLSVLIKNPLIVSPFLVTLSGIYYSIAVLDADIFPKKKNDLRRQMQKTKSILEQYHERCKEPRRAAISSVINPMPYPDPNPFPNHTAQIVDKVSQQKSTIRVINIDDFVKFKAAYISAVVKNLDAFFLPVIKKLDSF